MDGHRKKGGLVTTIMVAALTLLGSTLVASPASAGEANGPGYAGPCPTLPAGPLPGWVREQRTYYLRSGPDYGQTHVLTMDYKAPVAGGDTLEACFFPGFVVDSVYYANVMGDPSANVWYFMGKTEYLQSTCPNDGKLHRWNIVMEPFNWNSLDGYWITHFSPYGYCGTEVSPGGPVVNPPAIGSGGMPYAQAKKVCAAKAPGRWKPKRVKGHGKTKKFVCKKAPTKRKKQKRR